MKRTDLATGAAYAMTSTPNPGRYGQQWTADPGARRVTLADAGRWRYTDGWERRGDFARTAETITLDDGTTLTDDEAKHYAPVRPGYRGGDVLVRREDGALTLVRLQELTAPWDEHTATVRREGIEWAQQQRQGAQRKAVVNERADALRARYGALVGCEVSRYALGAHSDGRVTLSADEFEALLDLAEKGRQAP